MTYLRAQYVKIGIFRVGGGHPAVGAAWLRQSGFPARRWLRRRPAVGMYAATKANVRVTAAAREHGAGEALLVGFDGGAVMGLAVASRPDRSGLAVYRPIFQVAVDPHSVSVIWGFSMGASSVRCLPGSAAASSEAADVGSDLVGKVEAGIPGDVPPQSGA
ncbi:MAG: sodium/proton-translocating pyrophosphatase [Candidatus Competibacteraceae bacterium]